MARPRRVIGLRLVQLALLGQLGFWAPQILPRETKQKERKQHWCGLRLVTVLVRSCWVAKQKTQVDKEIRRSWGTKKKSCLVMTCLWCEVWWRRKQDGPPQSNRLSLSLDSHTPYFGGSLRQCVCVCFFLFFFNFSDDDDGWWTVDGEPFLFFLFCIRGD